MIPNMMMMMPRRIHGVFFSVRHRGSTPRRRSCKTQREDDNIDDEEIEINLEFSGKVTAGDRNKESDEGDTFAKVH